jgi:hypothetical protein
MFMAHDVKQQVIYLILWTRAFIGIYTKLSTFEHKSHFDTRKCAKRGQNGIQVKMAAKLP